MIKQIVQGHIREFLDLNTDLKDKRLQICYMCPLYSNVLGGVCNSKLYLNPITGDVRTTEEKGYYRGCGCRLQAKTRLEQESCPASKW